MIIVAAVVYVLAHQHPPDHLALEVWTWATHHVVIAVLLLVALL